MLLAIYLNDHLTAATAGRELARRALGSNRDTRYGPLLNELAAELEEDRQTLLSVMRALDVGVDRLKVAAGWAGEKLGRLKPNGRLRSYSPLSRLVELEGLTLLVRFNRELWESLQAVAETDSRLEEFPLAELVQRAEAQLRRLETEHRAAAGAALVTSE